MRPIGASSLLTSWPEDLAQGFVISCSILQRERARQHVGYGVVQPLSLHSLLMRKSLPQLAHPRLRWACLMAAWAFARALVAFRKAQRGQQLWRSMEGGSQGRVR
jgi:hypothetical protein